MDLLDLIFPKQCINCNSFGEYLCTICTQKIIRHKQICIVCRKTSLYGQTHEYCQNATALSNIIIATEYKDTVKKALVRVKYGLKYDILKELIEKTLVSQKIGTFLHSQQIELCTEVPMHHFKQNQRGFNQALLITKWVEKNYTISYQSILQKTHQTNAQMSLKRNERLFNLSNAFQIKNNADIANKNILLIDDVTTTGTTLEEAATTLKKAGAKNIIALVIANG